MQIIQTTEGPMELSALRRTPVVEDRPDCFALLVRYEHGGVVVRQDAFRLPKQDGEDIPTIYGPMPRAALRRLVEFADNPDEMAVAEVFTLPSGELVHRSVHVVMKEPSVAAAGVAAALG